MPAPGLAAPSVGGQPRGAGRRQGEKKKRETEIQTRACGIIAAVPWQAGNGASSVFEKIQVGQRERSRSLVERVVGCEKFCLSLYLINLQATAITDPFAAAHAPLPIT